MTYSKNVKDEISKLNIDDKLSIAELQAFTRTNLVVSVSLNGKISLTFTTENSSTARRIFSIIKKVYLYEAKILVSRSELKKNRTYKILVKDEEISIYILEDSNFDHSVFRDLSFKDPDKGIHYSDLENMKAFLRGAFLGAGTIVDPKKSYHAEIIFASKKAAEIAIRFLKKLGVNSSLTIRKENFIVYIKEADDVSDFLSIIGANKAVVEFENVRVLKEVRNNVNRIVNCETANISKIINASSKQLEAIEKIESKLSKEEIPEGLYELMQLRKKYRDDSLKSLGEKLDKPVAKSTVNHRMKKIIELADSL